MSDFEIELYELLGGGDAIFLGPGLEILDGDGGDGLGYGESGVLPPYEPIVAGPVAGETPRWNPTPSNWYSMIWVVLGPDFGDLALEPLVPPFVPGPEVTSGSTATPEQISAIKRQILKWKSPHAYPDGVILYFPGVVCPGPKCIPPFTQRADLYPLPWAEWFMGKAVGDSIYCPPFTPGGYQN